MRPKLLRPDQIVALNDYPLHNEHILKIYFRVFSRKQGGILPPCPVLHKSAGLPYAEGKGPRSKRHNALLDSFLKAHPDAEYFLMDGSHKTTAATLAHRMIPAIVIKSDVNLADARKLAESGEIFGWHSPENSVKQAVKALARHHSRTKKFLAVDEKTKLLVARGDVPKYMAKFYGSKQVRQ
jgi:hypothetical protein